MQIFFLITLFIFWMLFWSFWSVIIYRFKSWEKWIMSWRSHCPKCNHKLNSFDLIPLFSWLFNKWKCRYCKEKISKIYPILEISTWILFTLIWYFLIDINLLIIFDVNEIIKLIFWLIIWFYTIIYTFYDILFLEINDSIMFSAILFSILAIILQNFWLINIIDNLPINNWYIYENYIAVWILITWIALLYLIMLKWLKEIYDIFIILFIILLIYLFNISFTTNLELNLYTSINSLIWALWIFIFFFIQILISKGAWLWGWDLRIAIFIWLIMGASLSLVWLFLTYFIGSIISILILIYQKFITKKINTQIPFWPFLAIWFFVAILFQNHIFELTKIYL